MKVEINTLPYEFSHHRKPRGKGNWMMELRAMKDGFYGVSTFIKYGTLTEAVAAGRKKLTSDATPGFTYRITILP